MAKKRVSKVVKRRLTVFGSLCIASIIYCVFTFTYHTYTLIKLTNQKKELNTYYKTLKTDANNLEDQIQKFSDKEYLARYARENYSYSTDNEYIIKITDDVKNDIDKTDELLDKNYIIIILSSLLVLIFIYILKKDKSNNKSKKKKQK